MLETKITEILKKQRLIEKKLDNHEIRFLESEEELNRILHEIEKELKKETFKSLKEPTTENHIECSCGHKAKYKDTSEKTLNTGRTKGVRVGNMLKKCQR